MTNKKITSAIADDFCLLKKEEPKAKIVFMKGEARKDIYIDKEYNLFELWIKINWFRYYLIKYLNEII